MKYILLSLALLFAFGCKEEIDGTLSVQRDIKLKWKTGYMHLGPGNYGAEFRISSKDKAKLSLHGRDEYHSFRFPEGTKLPERRGEIFIPSEKVNQPYDVLAQVDTHVRESNVRRDWESCYYERPYTRCDNRGRCWTEYRRVYGQREIEYIDVYTDRDYSIDLLEPGTKSVSATFSGEHTSYHRRYLYQGRCY